MLATRGLAANDALPGSDTLERALASLRRQTRSDFEVCLVNDGGTCLEARLARDPVLSFQYVSWRTPRGVAAARNAALSIARGRYITYLDDDDVYHPDHLATLTRQLEQAGENDAFAYTDAQRLWRSSDRSGRGLRTDLPVARDFDLESLRLHNFIPTVAVGHTRGCTDRFGGFDPSLSRCEDWDLWLRLAGHIPFTHVRRVTCTFSARPQGGALSAGPLESYLADVERIYARHPPEPGDTTLTQRRRALLEELERGRSLSQPR